MLSREFIAAPPPFAVLATCLDGEIPPLDEDERVTPMLRRARPEIKQLQLSAPIPPVPKSRKRKSTAAEKIEALSDSESQALDPERPRDCDCGRDQCTRSCKRGAGPFRNLKPKPTPGNVVLWKRNGRLPQPKSGYRIVVTDAVDGMQTGMYLRFLAPNAMGPVHHGQGRNLPPAGRLCNMVKGNELHADDIDEEGVISEDFYARRLELYLEPKGPRYKTLKVEPVCWLWVTNRGVELQLTKMEMRKVFCKMYERVALTMSKPNAQFRTLQRLVDSGCDLQICAGEDVPETQSLEQCYNNEEFNFGYEHVLLGMLTKQRPWAGNCAAVPRPLGKYKFPRRGRVGESVVV